MSSSTSTKTSSPNGAYAAPDLNKVIAAAGHQIFSYLPLGSLVNGLRSPILTNTIFHDSIFQSLGQTNTLCLSAAPHLRKISDDQLITFIRNIVEVSEAYHPGYNHRVHRRRHHDCSARRHTLCPAPIKVSHLDLSRCRNLLGEGVHYCIKHMPSVERILLVGMTRFMHSGDHFHTAGDLSTRKLQYLDVSQCAHLNTLGIKRIITTIQGKNIKHLDFSGCSEMIDDSVAGTVAFCRSLESLNLEGCKKISSFGVGLISYVTRHTLRCLSLRHCEDVHLPKLLMALADELIDLAGSDDDYRAGSTGEYYDDNLMKSFAVYGGAFLMRPVGGMIIGTLGDKYGRKHALVLSLFLMAVPTFVM